MSPTPVIRRGLAAELRALRDAAGLSTNEVAARLNVTHSKISKIEHAHRAPSLDDVLALAELFGIEPGPERDRLIDMARRSRRTLGWWHPWRDITPEWARSYLRLEAEAEGLDLWEPDVIPGLLQTADYARALTTATLPEARPDDIARRVDMRLARQTVTADRALWVVIGDAALCRPVGEPAVMADQLDHLLARIDERAAVVQVLPVSVGAHPGTRGPFTMLRFPPVHGPDGARDGQGVVYLEWAAGAAYIETPAEVARFARVMDHVRALAAPPEASRLIIESQRKRVMTRG